MYVMKTNFCSFLINTKIHIHFWAFVLKYFFFFLKINSEKKEQEISYLWRGKGMVLFLLSNAVIFF